tara:strand:+ start:110 stop:409 length:300 start_codon:yes stop_codon:yes gene_type:complete
MESTVGTIDGCVRFVTKWAFAFANLVLHDRAVAGRGKIDRIVEWPAKFVSFQGHRFGGAFLPFFLHLLYGFLCIFFYGFLCTLAARFTPPYTVLCQRRL